MMSKIIMINRKVPLKIMEILHGLFTEWDMNSIREVDNSIMVVLREVIKEYENTPRKVINAVSLMAMNKLPGKYVEKYYQQTKTIKY